MNNIKQVIIHDADEDGYLSAVIFKQYLIQGGMVASEIDLIATRDRKCLPEYDYTDKHVAILDLTYTREQIGVLIKSAKYVCIIDHHQSDLHGLVGGVISTERCTAWLTWEYCYATKEIPWVVSVVDSYDRDFMYGDFAKTVILGLRNINQVYEYSIWDYLLKSDIPAPIGRSSGIEKLFVVGEAAVAKQKEALAHLLDKKKYRLISYKGYTAAITTSITDTAFINVIGNALSNTRGIDMLINHYFTPDNELQVSFRSSLGVNVEVLAKELGGGGHITAAGARLPFKEAITFLESIQ